MADFKINIPTTGQITYLHYDQVTEILYSTYTDGSIRQTHIPSSSFIEGTWVELNTLATGNDLETGQVYVLTDYKTKYYIENSMTNNIIEESTVTETVSGYAYFENGLNTALQVGDTVTIEYLPPSYAGSTQVGDTTTITELWNGGHYYIHFANDLEYIPGAIISYSIGRFPLNPTYNEVTLNDANGKPILTPIGLVNTDVHDGTEYMEMSAVENLDVPTERLLLVAISDTNFSVHSESLTFLGDIVEYDFNDTEVKNANGTVIDTRNGFVLKRSNSTLNIDVDKDWRVHRYRRYKVTNSDTWDNYILNNSVDKSLYLIGSDNACSITNVNLTEDHKYILKSIQEYNVYNDFTLTGTVPNPFLTGVSSAPSLNYSGRFGSGNNTEYQLNVICDDPTYSKDINIIPLDANYNPLQVIKFKSQELNNTVFQILDNGAGLSKNITVDLFTIIDSTFMSGGYLSSSSTITALENIINLDSLDIVNTGIIKRLNILGDVNLINNGSLLESTIGTMLETATAYGTSYIQITIDSSSRLENVIIGSKRLDSLIFSNCIINKFLIAGIRSSNITINNSNIYLTAFKLANNFLNNYLTIMTGVEKNARKSLYGYYHNSVPSVYGKYLFTNNVGDLLYETVDGLNNNQIVITAHSISQ